MTTRERRSSVRPREFTDIGRYQRLANFETVLAIRERQRHRTQQMILWCAVVLIALLGIGTATGWL